jgi:hypothetical protein
MSDKNPYIAQMAAAMGSPITYTATGGSMTPAAAMARIQANCDLLLSMLSYEGTDQAVNRLYFDEMSNPARVALYKTVSDLKASAQTFTAI